MLTATDYLSARCAQATRVLSVTEPLWVFAALVFVNLSYLLQMNPALTWGALAVAFLPFLLRLLRHGYRGVKTPFDPAVALMVAGGVVGLLVSPTFGLSLGAFQSLLAVTLAYYFITSYHRPASLVKWALPLFVVALLIVTLFVFSYGSSSSANVDTLSSGTSGQANLAPVSLGASDQANLTPGKSHGLALGLLIAAAISAGFAAFDRRLWLRLTAGFSSAFFLVVMVAFTNGSIMRLLAGESIAGRLPRWQDTIEMLKDQPLTGIGLGSWASLYNHGAVVPHPTSPHNAYLELYANTGLLGALAFLTSLAVAIWLGWRILRSSRSSPWYGLGVGVLLACLLAALVGLVESAPAGILLTGSNAYFYVVSPVPWMLAALLVVAHKLLREESLK